MPRSRHRKKKASRTHRGRRYVVDEDLGIFSPPEEKMSGVILEFLEPYRQFAEGDDALHKLVSLGIVAWNVALLPEAERESALNTFAVAAFGEGRPSLARRLFERLHVARGRTPSSEARAQTRDRLAFKATIREMIERKLLVYPENRRFIVDYRLACEDDHVHLSVISTLERPRL